MAKWIITLPLSAIALAIALCLAISPTRQAQNSYLLDVTVLSDTPNQPQRKESP